MLQAPEVSENLKGKKVVLVHGEGFGAWCWYKNIALLEESGLVPVAVDLSGSGIDTTDTNSVSTLVDYSKPLITYLQDLPDDEKVYAMPFITVTMAACLNSENHYGQCHGNVIMLEAYSQVILIGHGCGGASVSYAMEQCPQKIAKAIFVCATMVSSGQRPFDIFTEEVCLIFCLTIPW